MFIVGPIRAFDWVEGFRARVFQVVHLETELFQAEQVVAVVPKHSAKAIRSDHAGDHGDHGSATALLGTLVAGRRLVGWWSWA